jgi:hypothetical protein
VGYLGQPAPLKENLPPPDVGGDGAPPRRPAWLGDTSPYRCDTYLAAAIHLQLLGREAAIKELEQLARDPDEAFHVIILCRMLFMPRKGAEFRRAGIGATEFYGKTKYEDWPLEPIELIDGVPFLISWNYYGTGIGETGKGYLDYCAADCEWNDFRYASKGLRDKTAALEKLLGSAKWVEPPSDEDTRFLSSQIR